MALQSTRLLRRTRTDVVVIAALSIISVAAVLIVYAGASIRNSEAIVAEHAYEPPAPRETIPEDFSEAAREQRYRAMLWNLRSLRRQHR